MYRCSWRSYFRAATSSKVPGQNTAQLTFKCPLSPCAMGNNNCITEIIRQNAYCEHVNATWSYRILFKHDSFSWIFCPLKNNFSFSRHWIAEIQHCKIEFCVLHYILQLLNILSKSRTIDLMFLVFRGKIRLDKTMRYITKWFYRRVIGKRHK